MFYQHLKSTNTINGNPQRLFAIYNKKGEMIKIIDEGYGGEPFECKNMIELPAINIEPKEYKRLLKIEED